MTDTKTTSPAAAQQDIVARARLIGNMARGMADQIDTDRRLPAELVGALRDSGLLRAGAPTEVDALELPPGTALRCGCAACRSFAARTCMLCLLSSGQSGQP